MLLAILIVCVAPVVASYLTYYVVKPQGRTNYGELLDPQRPTDGFALRAADGTSATLAEFRGKWVMLTFDPQGCAEACASRLYVMRQVRLTTGKERDRIERVLLVAGDTAPAPALLAEHEGLHTFRVQPDEIARWLPPAEGAAPGDHIYVVDPLGNVMMRFPKSADPNRMKKDISKLLRASRVG